MKKSIVFTVLLLCSILGFSLLLGYCRQKENTFVQAHKTPYAKSETYALAPFDSTLIATFFVKYPTLKPYQKQVVTIYQKQQFKYIWFDSKGKKETAGVINNKINNLEAEGLVAKVPYQDIYNKLYEIESAKPNLEVELFLTTYYCYYTTKVLHGIDDAKSNELGWYLPRKKQSYVDYLDSLLVNPKEIEKKDQLISQYYKLKDILQKYRDIEKKGGWSTIPIPPDFKSLKLGDTATIVASIRTRLFLSGHLASDSKSTIYDESLKEGLLQFKRSTGYIENDEILPKHIAEMNIPVSDRIKTIMVNMERCRWMPVDISKSKEWIVINIPSFKLRYFKNGKTILVSNVVVGKVMNKTAIFSGMMQYIVFSPYWNVPKSILRKEILPAIRKNRRYLSQHHMEWYKGDVRQKPGLDNSLGLIKFLFPNSNNIYLHDTPSKNLFNEETRAFSHGCIRVEKPRELAQLILQDDPNWTPEKIDEAINRGKESWYTLSHKIPVYIGYFTAWVDESGTVNFYKDIYDRDHRLADMLVE